MFAKSLSGRLYPRRVTITGVMKKLSKVLMFCVFLVAMVLFIIGFSTPWWASVGSVHDIEISAGLWQRCYKQDNTKWACSKLSSDDGMLNASRAMLCLALIASAASLVFFVMWLAKEETDESTAALACCLVTSVLSVTGVSLYAADNVTHEFQWSFVLSCCSTILLFLDGAIGFILLFWPRQGLYHSVS